MEWVMRYTLYLILERVFKQYAEKLAPKLIGEKYTVMFAVARIVGWSAHRIEEQICTNKIIRPAYMSVMEEKYHKFF